MSVFFPRWLSFRVRPTHLRYLNFRLNAHQGAILLFEALSGRLHAIVDASEVTAVRTAAASACATRLLSRPDSKHLALIGSGAQAMVHLEAMLAVRGASIDKVTVWSRTESRLTAFVSAANEALRSGALGGGRGGGGSGNELTVLACASAEEAVAGADIVCTLTSASEPVLKGSWLKPGAHVNAVGACTPAMRELDSVCVVGSRLYTDNRESCLSEPGDIVAPLGEGLIGQDHIKATLGELLQQEEEEEAEAEGPRAGSSQQRLHGWDEGTVTLFESLGLAIHDLVSALEVVSNAKTSGEEGCTRIKLN
jgi:ornithine cyclodeaminase